MPELYLPFHLQAGVIVYYRCYLRRTTKKMNFDNPVYRKTTDDQVVSLENNPFRPSRSIPPVSTIRNAAEFLNNPFHYIVGVTIRRRREKLSFVDRWLTSQWILVKNWLAISRRKTDGLDGQQGGCRYSDKDWIKELPP